MAKGLYIGLSNVAKKGKKAYLGVGGVARKIKKMYVGDANGKARLAWNNSKELKYYGTATDLSAGRQQLSATTFGDYALFCGGCSGSGTSTTYYNKVDTYNASLTRSAPSSAMWASAAGVAAASNSSFAFLAGGRISYQNAPLWANICTTYDLSLTRTRITNVFSREAGFCAATTLNDYAMFGGGLARNGSYDVAIDDVVAFNTSKTKTTTNLSSPRGGAKGVSIGNYALFGGGLNPNSSTYYKTVDAYTSSLTYTAASDMTEAKGYAGATTVGNYALFAGGTNGSGRASSVNAYNASLTRSVTTALTAAKGMMAATTIDQFAIFGGGIDASSAAVKTVDVYDSSLTHSMAHDLTSATYHNAATTIGNYALFGGGYSANAKVDVFTVE